MEAIKKVRSLNWTEEEKKCLFSLIHKRIHIIENKTVSASTIAKKEEAWKEVHKEFSAVFGAERTIIRLKEQWKRQKARAKANVQKLKQHRRATGGGCPAPEEKGADDTLTAMEWDIVAALPYEFTKDDAEFDSDELLVISAAPSAAEQLAEPTAEEPTAEDAMPAATVSDTPKRQCMGSGSEGGHRKRAPGSEGSHSSQRKRSVKESSTMTEYEQKVFELQKEKHNAQMERESKLFALQMKNMELSNEKLSLEIEYLKKKLKNCAE